MSRKSLPKTELHLASQERDKSANPAGSTPIPGQRKNVAQLAGEFYRWFMKRQRLQSEQHFGGEHGHGPDH